MKFARTAVLIADSFGSPFEELKAHIQPLVWKKILDVDVYYMRGKQPNRKSQMLNNLSEKYRYSKSSPVQKLADNLLLAPKSWKPPSILVSESDINVDVDEGLRNLGIKSLSCYRYLYECGYQNIYKTTLSSLVNPIVFNQLIASIPSTKPFYSGTVIDIGRRPFVSGANLFLNRKATGDLLSKRRYWQNGLLDDVAIGRLLNNCFTDQGIRTINVQNLEQLNNLDSDEISNCMHFRCKSSETPRNDVQLMAKLLEKLSL